MSHVPYRVGTSITNNYLWTLDRIEWISTVFILSRECTICSRVRISIWPDQWIADLWAFADCPPQKSTKYTPSKHKTLFQPCNNVVDVQRNNVVSTSKRCVVLTDTSYYWGKGKRFNNPLRSSVSQFVNEEIMPKATFLTNWEKTTNQEYFEIAGIIYLE